MCAGATPSATAGSKGGQESAGQNTGRDELADYGDDDDPLAAAGQPQPPSRSPPSPPAAAFKLHYPLAAKTAAPAPKPPPAKAAKKKTTAPKPPPAKATKAKAAKAKAGKAAAKPLTFRQAARKLAEEAAESRTRGLRA